MRETTPLARDQAESGEPGSGPSLGKVTTRTCMNSGPARRPLDRESSALPRLLTLRQAADYIQVSYWTVRSWVEAGVLPAVRLPGDGRLLRVERRELDRLIEQSRVGSSS